MLLRPINKSTLLSRNLSSRSIIVESFEKLSRNRVSQKNFEKNRIIPLPILQRIIELGQLAPSSFNMQPYKVIIIRSEDAKVGLSKGMLGSNIATVLNAPISLVFLADRFPSRLTRKLMDLELKHGSDPGYVSSLPAKVSFLIGPGIVSKGIRRLASHLLSPLKASPQIHCHQNEIWSIKNTCFFAQQIILACSAYGLESSPMEGYDELRVKYQLSIPEEEYSIPLVLSIGCGVEESAAKQESKDQAKDDSVYDLTKENFPIKKRFALSEVAYEDQYGQPLSFLSKQ